MKNRQVATVIVGAAVVAVLLAGPVAGGCDAIGIKWVAVQQCMAPPCNSCPPDMSDPCWTSYYLAPTRKAGADGYKCGCWNNLDTPTGVHTNLVRGIDDVAVTTDATVLWAATNTWSTTGLGEENNNFINDDSTGDNHTLMSGYLDQNTFTPSPTFVQITKIPDDLAMGGYDVVIYTLGGVSDRGGQYAVNGGTLRGSDLKFVVASGSIRGNAVFNGPDFVEASPDMTTDPDYGQIDWGNYVVFRGLHGNSVTITATNLHGDVPRAPINAIQISKPPSP